MTSPARSDESRARVVRAVLFDVDGTLVDSNDAHARAWSDALAEIGVHEPYERIRRMIGMGGDKILPELAGISDSSDEGKEIAERRGAIFIDRYLPTVKAFPDARALLERLRDDGLPRFIATSAQPSALRALLERGGLTGLFNDAATSGDAERSKPDPDIIDAAVRDSGCRPSELVMFGDTPYDVQAAGRAGVRCVAVRSGGWDTDSLAGAVMVSDGTWTLLREYEHLERLFES